MVDSDFFATSHRLLILQPSRLLLEYPNCDYTLQFPYTQRICNRIQKNSGSSNFIKKISIKAVYGVIEMEVNNYLVAVTKASLLGQVYHRKILQVEKMQFFCLASKQASEDKAYVAGLESMFSNKTWYFSDDYDLTNSLQQFISSGTSIKNKRKAYMYNADWIDDFLKVKAYEWITGFISGNICNNFIQTGASHSCELILITRRDRRRQGKRWITRGCDLDGNTANTAETQMIFYTEIQGKGRLFSHVQLRGSIPVIWKQTPDLKWSPTVTIHPNDKLNCDLTKKNYEDIKTDYENCTLVNLIDKKGSQKRIGDYFDKMNNSINDPALNLVWFDFHAECKNMKYENLAKLLDIVNPQIENYGYFEMEIPPSGQRASKKNAQKGIFRTNCMDCLDRTNVVQSVFARQLLVKWMSKLGMMSKGRVTAAFQKLPDKIEEVFRAQWTKNADVVSILYSGTPAMKTDFTATGKRTNKGAMNDGYYGVKRYFLGNFYDSRDQDLIDFSLGKLRPHRNINEKIRHPPCTSLFFLILILLVLIGAISHSINGFFSDDSFTLPYKILGGVLAAGLVLLLARIGKGVVLRKPIRGDAI